jgi:hypothetical protein
MSEFNETCHLEATSQEAGVELLRTAGASGFVLPPENGWVTIVPEIGQPVAPITRFSQGTLVHMLTADDRGWMFELFADGIPTSSYLCRWDGAVVIDDRRLDLDALIELLMRRGQDPGSARRALEHILRPRERDLFDDEDAQRPAELFAQLVGLSVHSLSGPGEIASGTFLLDAGVARVG